jgi:hypothetical protein
VQLPFSSNICVEVAQEGWRCGGGSGGGERRERRWRQGEERKEGSRGQARVAGWEGVGLQVDSQNFKGFFAK